MSILLFSNINTILLLITLNLLRIIAIDYIDHVSSGIDSNTELGRDDTIYSLDGNTRIKLGLNGQLNLATNHPIDGWKNQWGNGIKPGTGAVFTIQHDGNLVVYEYAGGPAKWAAGSNNDYPPQHLVVSNDGYAYMLNSRNIVKWSTTGIITGLPTFGPPTAATTFEPTISPTTPISTNCAGTFVPGPIAIADLNSVGTVTIGDVSEISFNFKVSSPTWTCPSGGWCHILRIGDGTGIRLPLISIDGADQHLHIPFTGLPTYNEYGVTNMLDGNDHNFYFRHTPTHGLFVFDGQTYMNVTRTRPYDNTELGNVHNIWVCDDSNPYPVDGYVWDLCVYSYATTTTTITPTTNIPTSQQPTTNIPTTNIPTTDVSTTVTPTTNVPTTNDPTTAAPTTATPTTNAPTTNAPTTFIPTTTYPSTDVPTTDVPTTDVPTTDVPTTDIPTTQQPVTAIPTTNMPNISPSDSPTDLPIVDATNDKGGEQGVDEQTTGIISGNNSKSGLQSQETASLTQKVVVIVALSVIIIIILFCVICSVFIIVKKMKNKKMENENADQNTDKTGVEMHRVLSFSQSPSTHVTPQHIIPSPSMSTPQMMKTNYANKGINEGISMNEITTDLPGLPNDNEINLEETEPDNAGSNYVTKGGFVNNDDNTPTGDNVDEGSRSESNQDGLYTKTVISTPQYENEDDLFNDDDDDLYKKPENETTGTLY